MKLGRKRREERFILCVDGGGMRGVIPSHLLTRTAEMLREEGDARPFAAHFDLIAGTSTGGLIALALASPAGKVNLEAEGCRPLPEKGKDTFIRRLRRREAEKRLEAIPDTVSVEAVANLYKTHGKEIFPRKQGKIFGGIIIDKYDEKPLEEFLDSLFHDVPLSEATIPTLVMSYDAGGGGRPFPLTSSDSHGFLFREAGRATSAAPTYFRPAFLKDRETGEALTLLDGGMVADNPVMFAYREAQKLYPSCSLFHVLSFSTGRQALQFRITKNTGVIGWLDPSQGVPIQKIYAGGIIQAANVAAESVREIDYCRVDGILKKEYGLDVTTPAAIAEMEAEAEEIFTREKDKLERFVTLLASRRNFDQAKAGGSHPREVSDASGSAGT